MEYTSSCSSLFLQRAQERENDSCFKYQEDNQPNKSKHKQASGSYRWGRAAGMNSCFFVGQISSWVQFFSFVDPWRLFWYQTTRLKTTLYDMEDLKRQERSRQQRISNAKAALTAAEKELQDVEPYEPPRAEMVSLTTLFPRLLALYFAVSCSHL